MKKVKRLEPRTYSKIDYVLFEDIENFHGEDWYKKYVKAAGPGNTCMVIPANDPSHNKPIDQIGQYYWDYTRFANVVDYNKPTYFD